MHSTDTKDVNNQIRFSIIKTQLIDDNQKLTSDNKVRLGV